MMVFRRLEDRVQLCQKRRLLSIRLLGDFLLSTRSFRWRGKSRRVVIRINLSWVRVRQGSRRPKSIGVIRTSSGTCTDPIAPGNERAGVGLNWGGWTVFNIGLRGGIRVGIRPRVRVSRALRGGFWRDVVGGAVVMQVETEAVDILSREGSDFGTDGHGWRSLRHGWIVSCDLTTLFMAHMSITYCYTEFRYH